MSNQIIWYIRYSSLILLGYGLNFFTESKYGYYSIISTIALIIMVITFLPEYPKKWIVNSNPNSVKNKRSVRRKGSTSVVRRKRI